MTIDDMINEAHMAMTGKYTLAESNATRVADMAAEDWVKQHPDFSGYQAFIAGAIYERIRNFQRKVQHEG